MDVEEIVAGLSAADREALLERLLREPGPEDGEPDLEERVARLEQLVAWRGPKGKGRGPWRGYGAGPGWEHGGYHHCPQCGHHHGPHCGC